MFKESKFLMFTERPKAVETAPVDWKDRVAKAYLSVPRTIQEVIWRITTAGFVIAATLTGVMLWKNPGVVFGRPVEEQSLIQRLAVHSDIKQPVFEQMEKFYYRYSPEGLMLVAWEELDALVGVWVKPADDFPGKAGPHDLTPDMRVLSGPFMFGECEATDSSERPGMTIVACPIATSFDVWGYVAVVVPEHEADRYRNLVHFLSHRITELIY